MATLQTPSQRPPPGICTIISETKCIIKAHYCHFLALSVLFLLPTSFFTIFFPTLIDHFQNNSQIYVALTDFSPELGRPIIPTETLLLFLVYYLINLLFSLCAIGSITYSVFHFFYGRPVKFISAIKSIFTSFFPLLSTVIVAQIISSANMIPFMIIFFLVIKGAKMLGFETEFSSYYFLGLLLVFAIVLIVVSMCVQVIVSMAYVVVVVESKWGLQSLRRSASLLKGMKRVAFSLLLIVVISEVVFILLGVGDGRKRWDTVQIVLSSVFLMMMMLNNLAWNTVLYVYCMAIHGELAFENAEEFGREYIGLPFDDEKVPHLASVVYA